MSLTPKQEKFCIEYVKTGNKSEAYRLAYDAENMASDTINNKAYALSEKGDIRARIEELKKELEEEELYTLRQSIEADLRLIKRYEDALTTLEEKDSDERSIEAAQRTIRYIGANGYSSAQDRLAKKQGWFEKDNKQKQVVTKDYSKLSDEELQKISELEQKANT